MKPRKSGYYKFLVIMLILDILFLLWCIVALIFQKGHPIEWIIYIIMDLTMGFPCTIRLFQKYHAQSNAEQKQDADYDSTENA